MSQRMAVFGGSFDPPHIAHVLVAAWARAIWGADSIEVIPAWAHPLKQGTQTPYEHRVAMCELAMEGIEHAKVSLLEKEIQSGRTLDVVTELKRRHPEASIRLVIGADILKETHLWHRWDRIEALAPPLVVGRSGYAMDATANAVELPQVSSTQIRNRLAAGQSVEGLVPFAVIDYIAEHSLYQSNK